MLVDRKNTPRATEHMHMSYMSVSPVALPPVVHQAPPTAASQPELAGLTRLDLYWTNIFARQQLFVNVIKKSVKTSKASVRAFTQSPPKAI